MEQTPLEIAKHHFSSRLFVGTGKFSSHEVMADTLTASGTEMATVALRRVNMSEGPKDILKFIDTHKILLLPNTSGAKDAGQAILIAQLARELGLGPWIKLEVIPDPRYLMPDPIESLKAAEKLIQMGFIVLPYIHADPVLAKYMSQIGCAAVMPLAAPIGSNRGLQMRETLRIIIEQATVPVIVDAGLGVPSHACEAMEMGADAVLVNTAIATAEDPASMAKAFAMAVEAGRAAFLAGRAPEKLFAEASSPVVGMIR